MEQSKPLNPVNNTNQLEKQGSLLPAAHEHVRLVKPREAREAGRSLAYSFAGDFLSRYLLDGDDAAKQSEEQKWRLHVKLMVYLAMSHCLQQGCTAIGPDFDCVALWMPPGTSTDSWLNSLRSGLWKLHFQLTREGRKRYFKEMLPLLHDSMHKALGDRTDDSIYLVYIGTKATSRGKGYAAKVLRHLMEKADAEGRPIYLESSSLNNNAYYAKFGFTVKGEIVFTRGREPVVLYSMVREPQTLKIADSSSFESQDSGRAKNVKY